MQLDSKKNYQIDLSDLENLITDKTKMIILTHPNNPTTTVFNRKSLEAIKTVVLKYNLVLVCDQAFEDFTYEMSILKSADKEGTACARYLFRYPALAGVGHFIHTYRCDGNPIPTFTGEPERVVIPDDIEQFTASLWEALDENNRISLYVRYIDLADGTIQNRMINKNQ